MGFRGVVRDEHYERGGILPIRFIADNLFVRLSAISRYTGYPITLIASFDPVSMCIVVPAKWIPAFAGMTVVMFTYGVTDSVDTGLRRHDVVMFTYGVTESLDTGLRRHDDKNEQ
jgi:hypothetical protein